jgi:hypothetical protein
MNSYKFNGIAGHVFRKALVDNLNITFKNIYREVKDIESNGNIIMKDGRKFKLKLEQLKDE